MRTLTLAICLVASYCCQITLHAGEAALQVAFGEQGLQRMAFHGHEYLLAEHHPQIEWLSYDGQDGRVRPKVLEVQHDPQAQQTTLLIDQGELAIRYEWAPDRLTMHVTLANRHEVKVNGFRLTLLGVGFPRIPIGSTWDKDQAEFGRRVDQPPIILASHGEATLAVCLDDYEPFVRFGFSGPHRKPAAEHPTYSVVADSVVFNSEAEDPTIAPGESFSFRLSLRFAEGDAGAAEAAPDVLAAFHERFPFILDWPDRRPIGRVFLASGAKQHTSQTNPRGWFSDPRIDITTEQGVQQFGERVRQQAQSIANRSRDMNAQGVIVWNIEGEENPHPITYIGDPRLLPKLAPEMDGFADEFFRIIRDAGIRTGVCIRPSRIREDQREDGTTRLVHGHWGFDRVAEMSDKIKYAQDRWGCTIFYIDTNTHWFKQRSDGRVVGRTIDAPDMIRLAQLHRDVLLIPEFVTPAYRSALVAYHELRSHGFGNIAATPASALTIYPQAFSWIIPNDGDIAGRWDQLVGGVRRGDVLSFDAWWSPAHNEQVKKIYEQAAKQP
jgi:hypothetical protein